MADNENTTKVEEPGDSEAEEKDNFSLDSLDAMLAAEDPDFANSLNELGPAEFGDIDVSTEGVDVEYTLEIEKKRWQEATGSRQKILRFLPFLPFIAYHFKLRWALFRLSSIRWRENLKHLGPSILAWFKGQMTRGKAAIGEGLVAFRSFSLIKKIIFICLLAVTGASSYLLYIVASKGLLPHEEELFVGSLADWSQEKFLYDPKLLRESFYDSTRTSQNILLMNKMVVNLRRSSESGLNPMGAFEFLVEGAAADVVVEIKDREPEVRDLFQRTLEEMTFDQVSSGEGKKMLCERLRKEVNRILTKGFVRRIFIKTAIVKP